MANYKKPQSPLQHKDGDYFYPLTTVDQIIVDDNTRLNSKLDHILTVDFSDAGNADATGVNADTLGGYAADEYAKAATVDNMLEIDLYGATAGEPNLVDADTLGGFDANHFASVEEMNKKLSMELLWENASPTSECGTITVDNLDLSIYSHVLVEVMYSTTLQWVIGQPCKVGETNVLSAAMGRNHYKVIIVTTSKIQLDATRFYNTYASDSTEITTVLIPYRIYGIKGVSA